MYAVEENRICDYIKRGQNNVGLHEKCVKQDQYKTMKRNNSSKRGKYHGVARGNL